MVGKLDCTQSGSQTMLKWTATACIVVATLLRAFEYHTADLIVGGIGTALWAYAAYQLRDKALFTVNAFCLAILTYGVLK